MQNRRSSPILKPCLFFGGAILICILIGASVSYSRFSQPGAKADFQEDNGDTKKSNGNPRFNVVNMGENKILMKVDAIDSVTTEDHAGIIKFGGDFNPKDTFNYASNDYGNYEPSDEDVKANQGRCTRYNIIINAIKLFCMLAKTSIGYASIYSIHYYIVCSSKRLISEKLFTFKSRLCAIKCEPTEQISND